MSRGMSEYQLNRRPLVPSYGLSVNLSNWPALMDIGCDMGYNGPGIKKSWFIKTKMDDI